METSFYMTGFYMIGTSVMKELNLHDSTIFVEGNICLNFAYQET